MNLSFFDEAERLALTRHVALYLDSYRSFLGQELLLRETPERDLERLFEAPFVAVSHGSESDPIFNFGNRTALALWGFGFEEFTRLPSRYSAEPDARDERAKFLESVRSYGYASGYSGIRATREGRRFRILDVTVWNLVDASGTARGQGATYERWEWL